MTGVTVLKQDNDTERMEDYICISSDGFLLTGMDENRH